MTPRRLRLSRAKGARLPAGAVSVARPSRWGNPYTLDMYRVDYETFGDEGLRRMAVSDFRGMLEGRWEGPTPYPALDVIRSELAGHNLACWCPLDQPCHADILIELSNQ